MKKIDFLVNWKNFVQFTFNVSEDVAKFISCQFALECNFGEADIYQINNNICGMKLPKYRITCAQGSKRSHAYYISVEDSIWDYFIWLCHYGFSQKHLQDLNKFIEQLRKCSYCPASDYVDRILNLKSQYYD